MSNSKLLSIEELNQELKDFLYIITHDLKNPVRGIKQSADWLLTDYKSKLDADGVKLLELLQQKSILLADMINALNSYSKISFKENFLDEYSFDKIIDAVTTNVNIIIAKEGQNNQLVIKKEYKMDLILHTDELKFSQILTDLLKTYVSINVSDQTSILCEINHTTEEKGDFHIISITSENTAITVERIKKIFSPFQEFTIGSKKVNTMMTLAQAKKLIELFGGELEAKIHSSNKLEFIIRYPKIIT